MPLPFYKGNKNNNGGAAFFNVDAKSQSVFVRIQQQTGYNHAEHLPSFKGGKYTVIQFNMIEIAKLIRLINEQKPDKFYHQSQNKTTNINFAPYSMKKNDETGAYILPYIGFGLSVSTTSKADQEKNTFKVGFSLEEAELLKQWLQYSLTHCFNTLYSEDIKAGKERAKRKEQEKPVKQMGEEDDNLPEVINSKDSGATEELF